MSKVVWPPPKPKFHDLGDGDEYNTSRVGLFMSTFDLWYAEHIESLGPGKVVTGCCDEGFGWFTPIHTPPTHKAIVIGIEPLKEPTAEELLESLVKCLIDVDESVAGANYALTQAATRAREYLQRKGTR